MQCFMDVSRHYNFCVLNHCLNSGSILVAYRFPELRKILCREAVFLPDAKQVVQWALAEEHSPGLEGAVQREHITRTKQLRWNNGGQLFGWRSQIWRAQWGSRRIKGVVVPGALRCGIACLNTCCAEHHCNLLNFAEYILIGLVLLLTLIDD